MPRMDAPLYNTEILRLAANIPYAERLADPMGSSEKRSPICGSRVTVDVDLDPEGRVRAVGLLVRACALGQASSALMARQAIGKTAVELAAAREIPLATPRMGERLDLAAPHRGESWWRRVAEASQEATRGWPCRRAGQSAP